MSKWEMWKNTYIPEIGNVCKGFEKETENGNQSGKNKVREI